MQQMQQLLLRSQLLENLPTLPQLSLLFCSRKPGCRRSPIPRPLQQTSQRDTRVFVEVLFASVLNRLMCADRRLGRIQSCPTAEAAAAILSSNRSRNYLQGRAQERQQLLTATAAAATAALLQQQSQPQLSPRVIAGTAAAPGSHSMSNSSDTSVEMAGRRAAALSPEAGSAPFSISESHAQKRSQGSYSSDWQSSSRTPQRHF
jgi:hypothetical protein